MKTVAFLVSLDVPTDANEDTLLDQVDQALRVSHPWEDRFRWGRPSKISVLVPEDQIPGDGDDG